MCSIPGFKIQQLLLLILKSLLSLRFGGKMKKEDKLSFLKSYERLGSSRALHTGE